MSQVTRCPSCGTRFKVVADQLRISQGWVRCGMCQSVFDASEDLQTVPEELLQSAVAQAQSDEASRQLNTPPSEADLTPDLEADSVDSASAGGISDSENIASPSNADEPEEQDSPAATVQPEADKVEAQAALKDSEEIADDPSSKASFVDHAKPLLTEPEASETPSANDEDLQDDKLQDAEVLDPPAEAAPAQPEIEPETATVDAQLADDQALLSSDVDEVRREVEAVQPADDEAVAADKSDLVNEPGFVRQARRQAFWHSTGMRVTLVLGSVLGLGAMAAQYAWQQRDALAAEYPATAPMLAKACKAMGCELQARREIADVVISGSGFKQLADAHQYQWSLTLENRSDASVATPMAELTLTDAQDKPLLRRVVDLRPLGAPEQLQPHQEWSVNVPVQVQDLSAAVAGYRALVFYP